MKEFITLTDAFKLLGLNRAILNSQVREITNFPKPVTSKKWNHQPTYDKDKILKWFQNKNVKAQIKDMRRMQVERRMETCKSYAEKQSTLDNKHCKLFLIGMFDPLEKRLEHETKKYQALQNSPKTSKIHLTQDW